MTTSLAPGETTDLLKSLMVTETGSLVSNPVIEEYEKKHHELMAELTQKEGQLFVLQQEYDQAKATYAALATRATELQAAAAGDDTVVRLIGGGVLTDVRKDVPLGTRTAFALGLLLAILLAILHALASRLLAQPNYQREPLTPIEATP
jgi:hypothetical protein